MHCKQYGFECTFFLPITETRFKKKRMDDDGTDKDRIEGKPISPQADKREVSVFGKRTSD